MYHTWLCVLDCHHRSAVREGRMKYANQHKCQAWQLCLHKYVHLNCVQFVFRLILAVFLFDYIFQFIRIEINKRKPFSMRGNIEINTKAWIMHALPFNNENKKWRRVLDLRISALNRFANLQRKERANQPKSRISPSILQAHRLRILSSLLRVHWSRIVSSILRVHRSRIVSSILQAHRFVYFLPFDNRFDLPPTLYIVGPQQWW